MIVILASRADDSLQHELETHVTPLARSSSVQISRHLPHDDLDGLRGVLIVLLSPDFLASQGHTAELSRALDLERRGLIRLVPVRIRDCDLESTVLRGVRCLPANGRPIVQWAHRDGAWVEVVRAIRDAIEGNTRTSSADEPSATTPRVLVTGPWFGISTSMRGEVEEIQQQWPPIEATRRILDLIRQRSEIGQAQLCAIARYDVIVDLSPWAAFARWASLGLHLIRSPEEDVSLGQTSVPALIAGPAGSVWPTPDPTSPLLLPTDLPLPLAPRTPLFAQTSALARSGGVVIAGVDHGASLGWTRALLRFWPDAPCVVEPPLRDSFAASHDIRVSPAPLDAVPINLDLSDYRRVLRVTAGQVRLSGQEAERPIANVFVEMEIIPTIASRNERPPQDESEHAGELHARDSAERASLDNQRLRASRILTLGRRIMLWGEAGTGKSTLLRWLACEATARPSDATPVWVTQIPSAQQGFADRLAASALLAVGLPDLPALRARLREEIEAGRALLLLDGLDEAHPAIREPLLTCVAALAPETRALVASRPIDQHRVESRAFRQVHLIGLYGAGPEVFLRRYFGDAPWIPSLLRDLRRMPLGGTWGRIPVLLSLAAALYAREGRLPNATLALYERITRALLERTAERWGLLPRSAHSSDLCDRWLHALQEIARRMLVPDDGVPRIAVSRREVSEELAASGLFAGGEQLRFVHLTLGEFLAARAICGSLATLPPDRWPPPQAGSEVLPMACALAAPAAPAALLDASVTSARDTPPWLSLLLRAIAYGGGGVESFCEAHLTRTLERLLELIDGPSGVLGYDEERLLQQAGRALLVARTTLARVKEQAKGVQRLLEPLLMRPGDLAAEARILGLAGGVLAPAVSRVRSPERTDRLGEALVLGGADARWIVEHTDGDPFVSVRIAAARALVADHASRPLLRELVDDEYDELRALGLEVLHRELALPLRRQALFDPSPLVREAAAATLEGDEAPSLLRPWRHAPPPPDMAEAWAAAEAEYAKRHLASGDQGDDEEGVEEDNADEDEHPLDAARIEHLDDQDPALRTAAVAALGHDANVWPQIRRLLHDPSNEVRAAAIEALAEDPDARPTIRELLNDTFAVVRFAAANALSRDVSERPLLRRHLRKRDIWLRAAAFRALANTPEARPVLEAHLHAADRDLALAAIEALGTLADARSSLRSRLNDPSPQVRATTVQVLADDAEARPLLHPLLDDQDPDVRVNAVAALADDAEARPRLRRMLTDPEELVRGEAVDALASDPLSRPMLVERLRDTDGYVRRQAVVALAELSMAKPEIRPLLMDEDSMVREVAVEALAGDIESQATILKLLEDPNDEVRGEAIRALEQDPSKWPNIRPFLRDPVVACRHAAILALAGDDESVETLQLLLADPNDQIREAASGMLRKRRPPTPGAPLESLDIVRPALRMAGVAPDAAHAENRELDRHLTDMLQAPGGGALDPALLRAFLGWLLVRLAWAEPQGQLALSAPSGPAPKGRAYGEVRAPVEDILSPDAVLVVRIQMLDSRLPHERLLHPAHNLVEAWRVARQVPLVNPPTLWIACINVDFEDLRPPQLAPGECHGGPTYWGFRFPMVTAEDDASTAG